MPDTNLLIIHQGALGDFVLAFPAIVRLQKHFNPVDVLCQSRLGKLVKALGLAENCYPLEAAYFASLFSRHVDQRIKTLLAQYEHILLFSLSDPLSTAINSVAGNLSCRLPPKPPVHQRIHVTEFILASIFDCGLITKAEAALGNNPLPVRKDRLRRPDKILLHPGAGSVRKRWPLSHFLQVEAALKKTGFKPEFILGPAEAPLAAELQQSDGLVHVLDDLLELLELYDSAGGYIGNDSGASHLAAYSGLPTTVIFGPTDPRRWAPIGRAVQIVRPELPCRPCFETEPANCEDPQCLARTTPPQVVEAFDRVYSNWRQECNQSACPTELYGE